MGQVTDEHFEALNQEYETAQWLFQFNPRSLESFERPGNNSSFTWRSSRRWKTCWMASSAPPNRAR